jgi:hypothetical protein
MAGVAVQHLALGLTLPQDMSDRAGGLRAETGEVFLPRVLAILARRLGERFGPGSVIAIRSLHLACRVRPSDLRDPAHAERVAAAVASQVAVGAQRPRKGRAGQALQADVQIYRDAAEYAAVRLIAAAGRHRAASGQRESVAELWADPRVVPPALRGPVLSDAQRLGGLPAVLARLPESQLAALVGAGPGTLGHSTPVFEALRLALAERRAAGAGQEGGGTVPVRPAGAGIAPQDRDRPVDPSAGDAPATGPTRARRTSPGPSDTPEPPPLTPALTGLPPEDVRDGSPQSRAADRPWNECIGPGSAPVHSPDALGTERGRPSAAPEAGDGAILDSQWCGLLYLVNLSLRLGLPERLWQIGVEEGAALAAMLGRLGDPDDPAARVLVPGFPRPPDPVPIPADWAWHELSAGLLPRPAWGMAEDRVPAFDAALRGEGPLSLASWGAGVHLAACEHLLGRALSQETSRALWRHPGQIVLTDEAVTVIQPVDAIDIDLRRAGLDADPGWLPWLGKTLGFQFVSREEGA